MAEKAIILNQKPQINISRQTAGRMWLVFFCAAAAVVQSSLSDSGASLILAGCALCSAILAELLINFRTGSYAKIKDGSAAASALVFSLLLPNQIHPVYAIFGALFAMVVVKYSFGGLGSNWLNPSLGGWLFVRLSWPGAFMTALQSSPLQVIEESLLNKTDILDTPMKLLQLNGVGTSLDSIVSTFLNNRIFSIVGAQLPSGYIDLLISRSPGIIADRGLLALLAGTIIITAFRINRSWIPLAFLGIFGILVYSFGDLPFNNTFRGGDVLFALFSGGTITGAFILSSDPVTGAKSSAGVLAGVILSGFLSWIFRYCGYETYGVFYAIALVNALTPVLRFFEGRFFYSHRLKIRGRTP